MMRDRINKFRRDRVTADVTLDTTLAADLAKKVAASTEKWNNKDKQPTLAAESKY